MIATFLTACYSNYEPVGGSVPEALAYVPADAAWVEFRDVSAAEERLELEAPAPAGRGAALRYQVAMIENASWVQTEWMRAALAGATGWLPSWRWSPDWGWSPWEVEWQVRFASDASGAPTTVMRVSEDFDYAGFERWIRGERMTAGQSGWGRRWLAPVPKRRISEDLREIAPAGVTVVRDRGIIVLGDDAPVRAALAGRTAADSFDPGLWESDDVPEYLFVNGPGYCSDRSGAVTNRQAVGRRLTVAQVDRLARIWKRNRLREPVATSHVVSRMASEVRVESRLLFPSEQAAENDQFGRWEYVDAWSDMSGLSVNAVYSWEQQGVTGRVEAFTHFLPEWAAPGIAAAQEYPRFEWPTCRVEP